MDLAEARRRLPELRGLSDESALNVIHRAYYPDADKNELAAFLGVKITPPPVPARTWGEVATDVGISALKGAIAVPAAALGVADIVTGGHAGRAAEAAGIRIREANEILDSGYSQAQQEAFRRVHTAEGFGDTFMAAVKNPSVIGHTIVESLPSIGAGGAVGRGVLALAPRVAPLVAGAIGEGAVSAGTTAEGVRQQTSDGLLTPRQAALAAGSGAATGALGIAGGTLAQRLGIADVDALLVRASRNKGVARGVTQRVLRGAMAEGVFEELPQSLQEQVSENLALGRPVDTGVNQAMVLGLLSGAAMGGAANLSAHGAHVPAAQAPTEPAGPLSRAAGSAPVQPVGADSMTSAQGAPAIDETPAAQELTVDPVAERIRQLPDGDREEALAAYNVLNRRDAPAGVRRYNSRLLDELLAKLEPAEEESAAQPVESSDPAALLASGMGRDPMQGALAARRDEQTAQANLDNWMARAVPLPLQRAQDIVALGAEQGHALEVVPHGAGQGFTVVPAEWLTPAMRGQVSTVLPMDTTPTGVLRADAAGNVTPETGAQAINTRRILAAQQAEARRKAELGLTPDIEAAQARIPRPPQGPDLMLANGHPFKTRGAAVRAQRKAGRGNVVEVDGGWVVRGAIDTPAAADETIDVPATNEQFRDQYARASELRALPYDTRPTSVFRAEPERPRAGTRAREAALGLNPDVEAVQAGVKRAPKPIVKPGDVVNKQGKPFANKGAAVRAQKATDGGEVIEVRGGWAVRTAAAAPPVRQELQGDHRNAPLFRRADSASAATAALGDRARATQKFIDSITAKWANAPQVVVASSMQDERIPQAVRDADAAQRSQGADEKVNGFHYRGKVYLVADALDGPEAAFTTLAHEALGHYGLQGFFGEALAPIKQQIVAMRKKEVLAKAQAYGMPVTPEAVRQELGRGATDADVQKVIRMRLMYAAEEVLAEMAQTTPTLGFVKRAIVAIRTWLREHVPGFKDMALSDDEIIRSFILPARGWVVRGDGTGARRDGGGAQFSRGGPAAAQRLGDAIKAVTVTDVAHRAGNRLADFRGLGLATLGRRQIVDIYGKDVPPLKRFNALAQQMDAEKNEAGAGADHIATDWGKLKDERHLAELMHDATLAQIDPAKDFVTGDSWHEYGRLRQRYEHLSTEAKEVYQRARDTYERHYAEVREAIRGRIERSELTSQRKADMLARMDDDFFHKIKGVYFPLARFGQYLVVVRDGTGKTVAVSRAETLNEADATRRQLLATYPQRDGFEVGKVLKSAEFNAAKDGAGRGFVRDLFGLLEKHGLDQELQDAVNQLYLSSLPDLSWAKHGIHRKGMPGFSQDARRAFAQNVFHGARYLAKLRYADQLQAQLDAMQKHVDGKANDPDYDSVAAQHVVDEMNKRYEALMNPKTNALSTALTSFGFIFHLGLSPASALVNMSQTPLVAYPIMGAKWGFDKAAAALLVASKQAAANRNDLGRALAGEEKQAWDEAARTGVIDVTMAHDLAGISQGEDSKISWKMRPVMKAASFLFHHAEKFNRQTTFVAAYRLAREAGAAHGAAYEQAVEATYAGHFDYAASNRPRAMQGNVARVVLLFKQYAQNMVYTFSRQAYLSMKGLTPQERAQARRALSGLLVTHALGAGVLGLPLVGTLLSIASFIGSSDDEPWDAETALRNVLADAIGQKPAEVLARGLSRLTPWDVSGRVGLDKLIFPDVREGVQGAELAESFMSAALGPVAGIGVNALKGAQDIADGHWLRGLEEMMPAALRGPLKAARYAHEGAVDKSGIVIREDVGAAALAGQALGFSPSDVRLASEARGAIFEQDQRLQRRRQTLMRQYAMAAMAGDQEGQQDARGHIARFNEKNPERRITPAHLRQSVRNRRKRIEQAEEGVYLPKSRRDALEAGRFGTAETGGE